MIRFQHLSRPLPRPRPRPHFTTCITSQKIADTIVDKFEYRPIAEASVLETSKVDKEAIPTFPVFILESFSIASHRIASLDGVENETGMEGVGVMGSLVNDFEEEVELIQAPIPNFFMDDLVLIESELAHDGTWWDDYLVLPNNPDSTLVGAEIEFDLVLLSDGDGDQIVPSTPVMTPMVPSFTYPTLRIATYLTVARLWCRYKRMASDRPQSCLRLADRWAVTQGRLSPPGFSLSDCHPTNRA
ncbi:hypothetical protein ISN45_At04g009520 [Arabidopsis thaliana x Arabidopsis arenosa]|uniref:Uncharacterized protein n=1 Tax=Arabidopsis thaliana x Arabidopsis arenosa TaxID=1240361 RepID=A0A8T2DX22_9BRAS|nr:hypothetical protein ISN45_At04g009520 [Arabidopsis thaliana x Arabidopsis arenosa]